MKKVVMIITVLLLSTTVFAGGIRVNSMGGIYSLIESTNYADFPQRLLTGGELACIGANGAGGSFGLVRMKLNNFLNLPVPIAWQIKAVEDMVMIDDLFTDAYLTPGWPVDDFYPMGWAGESTQRINSIFAFGLSKELIAGISIQMYSNSNSFDGDDGWGNEEKYEHSMFGVKTVFGATFMLGGDDFVDFGILFDMWSWDGSYTWDGDEQYKTGVSECDGIMKFGINARYYKTGTKIDYAPYMKFNTYSFSATLGVDEDGDPLDAERTDTYQGSVTNFVLGSGVHYKPAEGVKVYNEFEFSFHSESNLRDIDGTEQADSETRMTLLPTYRCGVELVKEIDPKTWWGFNQVQLWGGFNKTFEDVWGTDEYTNGLGDEVSDEFTDETYTSFGDNSINVTTGAALSNGNFKFEFTMDIGDLEYNDYALDGLEFDLIYYFK